jgi:hypothetical protein
MNSIKLYDLFVETLSQCGLFIFDLDEEDIEYKIFEEFDIGVISFLHPISLQQLIDDKLIDYNTYIQSILLRELCLEIQELNLWNIQQVKIHEKWKELMMLSERIYNDLRNDDT